MSQRQALVEDPGVLAEAHRCQWAFVLAATVRQAGDLDLAEECVQEAVVAAQCLGAAQKVPAYCGPAGRCGRRLR